MVASCQSGLEEVIDESAVQNELATTRTGDEDSRNDMGSVKEQSRSVLNISGYRIISGTNQVTYTVTSSDVNVSSYYIDWEYNTSVLYETAGGDGMGSTTITLKLLSSTNTSDTQLTVHLKSSSTGSILYSTTITIGCNGPVAGTSSVRIERASDGLEVYPSNPSVGLRPNTYYYGYLTNTMAPNMTLNWDFDHATVIYNFGNYAYFLTDDYGWTSLTVSGKMADSSVYKHLLSTIIYEGYDNLYGGGDQEEGEEESEDK